MGLGDEFEATSIRADGVPGDPTGIRVGERPANDADPVGRGQALERGAAAVGDVEVDLETVGLPGTASTGALP